MGLSKIAEKPVFNTRIKSSNVKIGEMFFGYLGAPFLAVISNAVFGAYLNRYYVDVLGWTRFGVFSSLLPIVSVLFVVLGNLMVGSWIDKTRTTAGKARPYLLISAPLLAVAIILMFLTPTEGSNLTQMIWIAVSYNLYYALAYPCYYTAHTSMVALSTRNSAKRGILATLSNASTVGAVGVGSSILVPILLQGYMFVTGDAGLDMAQSYAHWRVVAIGLMLLTVVGVMLEYYNTRERITEESLKLEIKETKRPTMEHARACMRNKYWWMMILFIVIFQAGQQFKNGTMSFYVRWMFSDVLQSANPETTSGTLMSALGLIGGIPTFIGMVLAWPIANKLGKQKSIFIGLILATLGGLVAFINVNNFTIVSAGIVLKGIGIIPAQYVILALLSDVLDHLEAKNGFRSDGFTMSLYSAAFVGLPGLVNGIFNGMLSGTGYVNTGIATDAATGAVIANAADFAGQIVYRQPAAVENVLALSYLGIDMITFVISLILIFGLKVEKNLKADQETILANQKAAVLAEGGTWVEPEERARLEQEAADQQAEADRIAELKEICAKKGLNFEEENKKYLEKQEKRKNSLIGKFLG